MMSAMSKPSPVVFRAVALEEAYKARRERAHPREEIRAL